MKKPIVEDADIDMGDLKQDILKALKEAYTQGFEAGYEAGLKE